MNLSRFRSRSRPPQRHRVMAAVSTLALTGALLSGGTGIAQSQVARDATIRNAVVGLAASAAKPPSWTGTVKVAWRHSTERYDSDGAFVAAIESQGDYTLTLGREYLDNLGLGKHEFFAQMTSGSLTETTRLADECPGDVHRTDGTPTIGASTFIQLFTPERFRRVWRIARGAGAFDVINTSVVCGSTSTSPDAYAFDPVVPEGVFFDAEPDAFPNTAGTRFRLVGTRTWGLGSPWVQAYRDLPDNEVKLLDYSLTYTYDLRRLSPDAPASQYPTVRITQQEDGDDVIRVQTNSMAPGSSVGLVALTATHIRGLRQKTANSLGVARFVVRDRNGARRTWYQAQVEPNTRTVRGWTVPRAIR